MRPSEIAQLLKLSILAREPVLIEGPPGIGKTEVVGQVAVEMGYDLLPSRLAEFEAVDLTGLPDFDRKLKTTVWYPPDWFPRQGCPDTVWFMDEWSQGGVPTQNVAGRLLNERRLGTSYVVPDNVYICGAANRAKDRAGTNRIPSQVASRMTRVTMEADLDDWLKYAFAHGVATEVIAFLKFRHSAKEPFLSNFDPQADVSPSPRAWVSVSNYIKTANKNKIVLDPTVEKETFAGKLGEATAVEFVATMDAIRKLGDLSVFLSNPDVALMPTEPMTLVALATALANKASQNNMMQIGKLADRMPGEYGSLMMMSATARDHSLASTRPYIAWATKHQDELK